MRTEWTLDDFRREEETGEWMAPDGVWYPDTEAALGYLLGDLCGCGRPDKALRYIHKHLCEVGRVANDVDVGRTFDFGSDGEMYFFWYWADNEGLTEHGGSVPGWLTERGEVLLRQLDEYIKAEDGIE